MLLAIPIDSYNRQFLIFLTAIKNNLMENSLFTRIIYSPTNIIFSGIYIRVPFINPLLSFNKYTYELTKQEPTVSSLVSIESDILQAYTTSKLPIYNLEKQLKQRTFTGKSTILLKISGVWENDISYGLAYKFIYI